MNEPFVSFHLPTRLLRFFFLFFSILLPLFFVWQRRWTNTLKLRFWWVRGHFLCCYDVDVLHLPSPSSVFSIISICCGFSCLKFSCMLLILQRSSKNTLKLQFLDFYKYGCVYIDLLQSFMMLLCLNLSCMFFVSQRMSNNTLKLWFLSQQKQRFLSNKCVFFVVLSKLNFFG